MAHISIRTIVGFCLVSLLVSSCGFSDDTDSSASPDPDKIIVFDTLPDQATTVEAEFLRAAHILITWYTPVEDSVFVTEEEDQELIDSVSAAEEEDQELIDSMSTTEEETRRSISIVSDTEEAALDQIRDIQDKILSGQVTFEEMAFNHSHCTSAADSGRLPDFTSGAITEELDSTISALEPGEISGIIRTRFGYHLMKRLGS